MNFDPRWLLLAITLLLGGCNDIDPYDELVAAAELDIRTVTLTPGPVLLGRGETEQMHFTATLGSGGHRDLTTEARWQSGDPAIATIDGTGRLTARADGSTWVRARFGPFSAQQTVTVNSADLVTLRIDGSDSVSVCKPTGFSLSGGYSDGSTRPVRGDARWTLAPDTAGRIGDDGELTVTAAAIDSVTVGAGKNSLSAEKRVAVIHDLSRIVLAAETLSLAVGERITIGATGIHADGSQTPLDDVVTWRSATSGIAQVEAGGHIEGVSVGSTTLTADCGGIDATLTVTVTPVAEVAAIEIENGRDEITVRKGEKLQLDLTAIYTSGHRATVTDDAEWSAETISGGPIGVGNTADDKGEVDTRNSGTAFIKAVFDNETAYIKVIVQSLPAPPGGS